MTRHRKIPPTITEGFDQYGRVRTIEELERLARKRGQCVYCGIKTHNMVYRPISNDHVYKGVCIRHYKSLVPKNVYSDWKKKYGAQFNDVESFTRRKIFEPVNGHGAEILPSGLEYEKSGMEHLYNHGCNSDRVSHEHRICGLASLGEEPLVSSIARPWNPLKFRPLSRVIAPELCSDNDSISQLTSSRSLVPHPPVEPPQESPIHLTDLEGSPTMDKTHGTPSRTPEITSAAPGIPPGALVPFSAVSPDVLHPRIHDIDDAERPTVTTREKDYRVSQGTLRRILHQIHNQSGDISSSFAQIKILMERCHDDLDALSTIVSAIWGVVASDDNNKDEATRCGITECVIDAVRSATSSGNAEIVEWCVGTLACLSQTTFNRMYIAKRGGIEATVEALQKFHNNPGVFEWSCWAICSLVCNLESGTGALDEVAEENMAIFALTRGVEVVIDAMKYHDSSSEAMQWLIRVLARFLESGNLRFGTTVDSPAKKLMDAGCISICASVLDTSVDAGYHESFSNAAELLYLLLAENRKFPIYSIGEHFETEVQICALACLQAIEQNKNGARIHTVSFRLMSTLAMADEQCKQMIAVKGGIAAGINSVSLHGTSDHLSEAVFQFLLIMSEDISFFDRSIISPLKDVIRRSLSFPSSQAMVCSLCGLISNLSFSEMIVQDDLPIDAVIKLSPNFLDPSVSRLITRAISSICSRFPESFRNLSGEVLCGRLVEGLCDSDVTTQCRCASALKSVSVHSKENRELIVGRGVFFIASAVMVSASSQALVQEILELITSIVDASLHPASDNEYEFPRHLFESIYRVAQAFPGVLPTACSAAKTMLLSSPEKEAPVPDLATTLALASQTINSKSILGSSGIVVACEAIRTVSEQTLAPLLCGEFWARCVHDLLCLMENWHETSTQAVQEAAAHALASVLQCVSQLAQECTESSIQLITLVFRNAIGTVTNDGAFGVSVLREIYPIALSSSKGLVRVGLVGFISESMRAHPTNEGLVQLGCSILERILSTEGIVINEAILRSEDTDIIVSALTDFPKNLDIQLDGCRILSQLGASPEYRIPIASHGGLLCLLNVLKMNSQDEHIVGSACLALMNLSADMEACALLQADSVQTIVATLSNYQRSAHVQEKGLGILQNVSIINYDAKKIIAEAGGIGAVIFAMSEFMYSPPVLERAYSALWSLAMRDENQAQIAGRNGGSLVVASMMANISSKSAQLGAVGCLFALSSNSTNRTHICAAGGIKAIAYAMQSHPSFENLQIQACRALAILIESPESKASPPTGGMEVDAILGAMKRFPSSSILQEYTCTAMWSIMVKGGSTVVVQKHAKLLRELMGVAASRYPEKCANRVIQALSCVELI